MAGFLRTSRAVTQAAHEARKGQRLYSIPEVGRTPGPRGTPSFRFREESAMTRADRLRTEKIFSEQSHGTCKPKPDRVAALRFAEMHSRVPLESGTSLFQPCERPLPAPGVQELALDLAGASPNSESCQMPGNRAYAGESYISGYDR